MIGLFAFRRVKAGMTETWMRSTDSSTGFIVLNSIHHRFWSRFRCRDNHRGGNSAFASCSISQRKSIRFIDAIFTATSATCVTGLVVLDTATSFSLLADSNHHPDTNRRIGIHGASHSNRLVFGPKDYAAGGGFFCKNPSTSLALQGWCASPDTSS